MIERERTSIIIDVNLLKKANDLVDKGIYRNRSHAIEEGLKKLLAEQES
jgi:Arc/MetJ-type ribon-helix-helix transcriptional regulator